MEQVNNPDAYTKVKPMPTAYNTAVSHETQTHIEGRIASRVTTSVRFGRLGLLGGRFKFRTEPNRTGLSWTKSNRTEPNRTEPNRTEPNRTEPNRTEPHRIEPNHTKPNQIKPHHTTLHTKQTKPSQIKSNQTKPNQTNQNQTKPNQIEPNTRIRVERYRDTSQTGIDIHIISISGNPPSRYRYRNGTIRGGDTKNMSDNPHHAEAKQIGHVGRGQHTSGGLQAVSESSLSESLQQRQHKARKVRVTTYE